MKEMRALAKLRTIERLFSEAAASLLLLDHEI